MGCLIGDNPAVELFILNNTNIYSVFDCGDVTNSNSFGNGWSTRVHVAGSCVNRGTFDEEYRLPNNNVFLGIGNCPNPGPREMTSFRAAQQGIGLEACTDPVYLAQDDSNFSVIFQLRSPSFTFCSNISICSSGGGVGNSTSQAQLLMRADDEFQSVFWNGQGSCFVPTHIMTGSWFTTISC